MQKHILLSVFCIGLHFLPALQAQSFEPDRQWRAFKLGLNSSIELPFLNGFEETLRRSPGTSGILPGLFSPTVAWGKGQDRWWELGAQMLERSINVDFEENFEDTKVPGRLNTRFYAGVSLERVYRSKINMGKMPVFWSFGLLPQYGHFSFRSNAAASLDWRADYWRLDYFVGPRVLFLDRKHFFMDFQTYLFGGLTHTKTTFESVNGGIPLNNVSNITETSVIWPFVQMRFSAGYRF